MSDTPATERQRKSSLSSSPSEYSEAQGLGLLGRDTPDKPTTELEHDDEHSDSDSERGDSGTETERDLTRNGRTTDDEDMDVDSPQTLDFDHTRKDANEVELEKLVFGDSEGFRSALKDFEKPSVAKDEADFSQRPDEALTAVPDGDLFFIDDRPDASLKPKGFDQANASEELSDEDHKQPAWFDSDDDRMQISLMSVPRLRKLRNFEGEDVISGTEYQRRLRRQYRALHPPPKWASWRSNETTNEHPKKRRKLAASAQRPYSDDGESLSEADSDISVSSDTAATSAPTLSSLLKSSASFTRSTAPRFSEFSSIPRLKPSVLDIDRLPDIVASASPQPHSTTSLSLHPVLPLVLTAGLSGMLYMHHIRPFPTPPDPPNPLVTSLHMKNTKFSTALFSPLTGTQNEPKIYMAADRRAFHTWTLPTGNISKITRIGGEQQGDRQQRVGVIKPSPCGRYIGIQGTAKKGGGIVNVLSASTLQWIAQARGEGRGGLADFGWWSDGEGLSLVGKLGEVAEWSVEGRRVVLRWQDQGGVGITVLAMGGGPGGANKKAKKSKRGKIGPDRWAVLGTNSGFVTVYDRIKLASQSEEVLENGKQGNESDTENRPPTLAPTPHATLSHLTTPVSHLSVSPCGQVLAMASKWKRDAIRLVHLSSGTVYRNWPTARTPIGRISSMTIGECEGVVQGSKDDEGRGMLLIIGNEQGIVRNWVIRG
ncbi:MAG: hypothetical protein Q9162_006941 [Coniocarpon cinnabarinum]